MTRTNRIEAGIRMFVLAMTFAAPAFAQVDLSGTTRFRARAAASGSS